MGNVHFPPSNRVLAGPVAGGFASGDPRQHLGYAPPPMRPRGPQASCARFCPVKRVMPVSPLPVQCSITKRLLPLHWAAALLQRLSCLLAHFPELSCSVQNGNSFATLSMPARSAVPHHVEALPRQASASYPDRDRDSRALQQLQAPGTDRLSPLMSGPPGFSPDVRRHPTSALSWSSR